MSGHVAPKSLYYRVFAALMVLTGVTIGVAFVHLGTLNFPVALGIAITKATLVILFFMHVKESSRLTKMIVAMAFFFLFVMLSLTMTDYMSRGWFASPEGTATAGTQVIITRPADLKPAPAEAAPAPAEPAR